MAEACTRAIRGVEIFERRAGSGPPVVVLHGGPGADHGYLLPGFDVLASGRTLIYYDQRGGGRSPVERSVPVGWQEQVADLEALRSAWDLETLTIAGYSWGGLLAMLYAAHHPERVARLALVSAAPSWSEARQQFEQEFAQRNLDPALQSERKALRESGLRERDPATYQQQLFELSVVPYFYDPSRATELTPFRITGRTQQEVWESLDGYDLRSALRSLSVPTLVLHGQDDPIAISTAQVTAECLRAEFVPLEHCGHVPYIEQPERFREVLDRFLPHES